MDAQDFETKSQDSEAVLANESEEQNNRLIMEPGIARPVKHRPTFTETQIAAMEKIFEQRQYLSPMERESLATSVGLTPQQVRVWFQNRRQKVKQFLTQKRNGQQMNGNKQKNDTVSTSALSLTPQQLSNSIDPILQLLLPKAVENGTKDDPTELNGKETEGPSNDNGKNEGEGSTMPTIIAPQTLLCLTPQLLTSGGASIQLTSGQGGSNITIPANAIQLLQGLVTSSLPLAKFTKAVNSNQPSKSPGVSPLLKAQSPTQVGEIEGTEIKSEELGAVPVASEEEELKQDSEDVVPLQVDGNQVLTTISSEILQQLLNLTGGDSLKATWNLTPAGSSQGEESNTPLADGSSPRKRRQVFSGVQTTELEKQFEICPYIDSKEREKLAERIGLHPDQVKVWFQNRRTKKTRISWRQHKEPMDQ